MYQNAAILAIFAFLFVAISGRIDRSLLSGPIIFVAGGFALGPAGLGLLSPNLTTGGFRVLAELTLAVVLFSDAAKSDLGIVRKSQGLPERLLLIGLPLSILLGFFAGRLLFPGFDLVEIALLAVILAPTDAALGKPVVTNARVPARIREALNFESGLNDGLCVPMVILLLDLAIGVEIDGQPLTHVLMTVAEEIGIGFIVGAALTLAAAEILKRTARADWIATDWRGAAPITLAIACFMTAQTLGGSGFIACFVGGLFFSARGGPEKHDLLNEAETAGDLLALLTWMVFGAAVISAVAARITGPVVIYSLLSLTLVRMLPVLLGLAGSSLSGPDRFFIGWFGPRGLASIVFGIIILDAGLPNIGTLEATIGCTVLMSVIAHGLTANPMVQAYSRRWQR